MSTEFDYDVFISYRTSISPDREIGQTLQAILEAFPVPIQLVSSLVIPKRRRVKVFRDVTDLNASADLDEALKEKLRRTRYLIVVCTEQLRQSPYCTNEVQYFAEVHGHDKIVLLLAKGEPQSAFPVQMLTATKVPLSADIRSDSEAGIIRRLKGTGVPRPERAIFKLLAPILGCRSPDELVQRDRQRFRRQLVRVTAVLFVLACAVVIPKLGWDYLTLRLRFAEARYDDDKREIVIFRQFNPFNLQMGTMLFEDELEGPDALNRVEKNSVLSRGFTPDWEQLVPLMSDQRKAIAEMRLESHAVGDTRLILDPNSDLREVAAWCNASPIIQSRIIAVAHDPKENMGYRVRAADALRLSGTDVKLGDLTAKDQSEIDRYRMAQMAETFSRIPKSNPFSKFTELGDTPRHVEEIFESRNLNKSSRGLVDLSKKILSKGLTDAAHEDIKSLPLEDIRQVFEVCVHFVNSRNSRVRMHSQNAIATIYHRIEDTGDHSQLLNELANPDRTARIVAAIVLANENLDDAEYRDIRTCQADSRPWARQGASLALYLTELRKIPVKH